MKTYYILIHWNKGSAVTGFLCPNCKDEKDALRLTKKSLLARKFQCTESDGHGELSLDRINAFLKSLKRPWRLNNRDVKRNKEYNTNYRVRTTVEITELTLPVLAGYWLQDIITGKNICNQI
jgi:hypothetical protein